MLELVDVASRTMIFYGDKVALENLLEEMFQTNPGETPEELMGGFEVYSEETDTNYTLKDWFDDH